MLYGTYLLSPITKELDHIVCFAFVDDTYLLCFKQDNLHLDAGDIMKHKQQGIDQWEEGRGLKLTGCAIVPEKSLINPIVFAFANLGKWHNKSVESIQHCFIIQEHTGKKT